MPSHPRHLFACWSRVSARLRDAPSVALFLDFDGTLAGFERRPEEVRLTGAVRRAISALERSPRCRVCVISGRRQDDLRNHLRVPGVRCLGLHGSEGRQSAALPLLDDVKNCVRRCADATPEMWVEDKGAIIAIHYAHASAPAIGRTREAVARVLEPWNGRFRVMAGHRQIEVAPAELPDKGAAVRRERASLSRRSLPVFVGDDVVDEPAFAALSRGITIRVGGPAPTLARYRLASVVQVRAFLERMIQEVA